MNCDWGGATMMYWGGPMIWLGMMLVLILIAVVGCCCFRRRKERVVSHCPSCTGETQPTYLRCPHCGDVLKSHCPDCSRIVEVSWDYCPDCQAGLKK